MPALPGNGPMRDVLAYPRHVLCVEQGRVIVSARYRRNWDDGFGARGWKVECALDDPQIIASTRETGDLIPTSVFVHDLLDHLLSGFAPSGHRAEAMALTQLEARTGSDIAPDFEQLAREDILAGRVNGEPFEDFLGAELMALADLSRPEPRAIIAELRRRLGERSLIRRIVARFRSLGASGDAHARRSGIRLGIAYPERTALGLVLQDLLEQADRYAETTGLEQARARIRVAPGACALTLYPPKSSALRFAVRT